MATRHRGRLPPQPAYQPNHQSDYQLDHQPVQQRNHQRDHHLDHQPIQQRNHQRDYPPTLSRRSHDTKLDHPPGRSVAHKPVQHLEHQGANQPVHNPAANKRALTKLRMRIDHDPHYGLKRLKIGGKELDELPVELFELVDLEFLTLSPDRKSSLFFHLTSVPGDVSRLVNLRVLCLDTNELTEVHPAVCQLRLLERLVLSNNLLTSLPAGFHNLKQLKSLHLANNYFAEIPGSVFRLHQLEFLDASDNKLTALSDRIGDLVNLEALLLLFNLLETFPETIMRCSSLRNLWLGMNRLTTLPRGVGQLEFLDWAEHEHSSNLEGNPLVIPPTDVCRRGPASIEKYYQDHGYSPMPIDSQNHGQEDVDDDIMSDNSGSSLGDSLDHRAKAQFQAANNGFDSWGRGRHGSEDVEMVDASPWQQARPDNRPGRQRQLYDQEDET